MKVLLHLEKTPFLFLELGMLLTQYIEKRSDVNNHFLLTAETCTQLTHHFIGLYDVDCIATLVIMTEGCAASMRRYGMTFNHCDVSKAFVPETFVFLTSYGTEQLNSSACDKVYQI